MPEWVADSADWQGYAGFAASFPIYQVVDAAYLAGSMETTTTVVVNDGTKDYTVIAHEPVGRRLGRAVVADL